MYKVIGVSLLLGFQIFAAPKTSAQEVIPNAARQITIPAGVQDGNPSVLPIDDQAYRENANDDLETKLMKEKIRAAILEIDSRKERFFQGQDSGIFLFEAQKRLAAALIEYHKEPAKLISLLEKNVEIAREIEKHQKLRSNAAVGRPDEYAIAIYFRADAELQLLRVRNKYKNK